MHNFGSGEFISAARVFLNVYEDDSIREGHLWVLDLYCLHFWCTHCLEFKDDTFDQDVASRIMYIG